MGMVVIIFVNAEDVAPGMWNGGQQADITERNTATPRAHPRPHRIVSGNQVEHVGRVDRMDAVSASTQQTCSRPPCSKVANFMTCSFGR